jgi:glycosyltransferase involved in cell wall biosynthesis
MGIDNRIDRFRASIPITVLHIAPTPFFSDRGCHMRISGIIRALNTIHVHNILCTYNLGRDIDGINTFRTAAIPGYTRLEAGPSAYKYLADVLLFFKVCSIILRKRPNVIHGHLHEGALIGWLACLVFFWRRIPLVFDVQGSLVGELESHSYFGKSRFLKRIFRTIEYLITKMPDRFVCSSENSVRVLRDVFRVNENLITLVNDGVDIFEAVDGTAGLSLPVGKTICIYTGGLQETKGLSYLFEVILETKRRGLACHFLIVGYPEQVMQEFCESNGLLDSCTIVGRIPYEKLGEYLGHADIAIEPKFSNSGEASGKLLNYMGAGLPVVCFDTTSNRQIAGDAGYYGAPGSGVELVDRIEALIKEPGDRYEHGAAGRARVRELFSWDKAAERIFSVYESSLALR